MRCSRRSRLAGTSPERVHVPNRDEFGALSKNLNTMTMHLATAYDRLRAMNTNLQQTVQEQLCTSSGRRR